MACISDEYYDTVLRGCRQCSLVCDPPYSSSGKNEECTANCPSRQLLKLIMSSVMSCKKALLLYIGRRVNQYMQKMSATNKDKE